jgi:hypothetical protein
VEIGKQTYTTTQRWLLVGHLYMSVGMADHFDEKLEIRIEACLLTTHKQLDWANQYQQWFSLGKKEGGLGDLSK